jgi:uncharacterized protein
MKIAIDDIPEEGLYLDFEENVSIEGYTQVYPVEVHLDVQKTREEIVIDGKLQAGIELQCSRCLKSFQRSLDSTVHMIYHPIQHMQTDVHELKRDEMDMDFYSGKEIDVSEMLREQILLNLQMKPLCKEDCKGICPKCGTDLNIKKCSCVTKEIDPRLEVLKKYFEKGKE